MKKYIYISIAFTCLIACLSGTAKGGGSSAAAEPTIYSYIVKNSYPHSEQSYTQGLQFIDGELWEGSGEYERSRLMRVDLSSGEQQVMASLPKSDFGEGITILGDTIYQLTWREGRAYIYSRSSGVLLDEWQYDGEGWGLTSDGERLYMSDGSSRITIRERGSFKAINTIEVSLEGEPLNMLNELEWIDGKIWANIYTTDFIAIIEPTSGEVMGLIDLTGLLPRGERTPTTDVLNGIAYDEATNRIFVTGKNWSKLYEIEIIETE